MSENILFDVSCVESDNFCSALGNRRVLFGPLSKPLGCQGTSSPDFGPGWSWKDYHTVQVCTNT